MTFGHGEDYLEPGVDRKAERHALRWNERQAAVHGGGDVVRVPLQVDRQPKDAIVTRLLAAQAKGCGDTGDGRCRR